MFGLDLKKIFGSIAPVQNAQNQEAAAPEKDAFLEYIAEKMGAGPSDSVLEVAACPASCGRRVAAYAGKVTCLDAQPSKLEETAKLAEEEGLTNMEFVQGFAEELPFAEDSFDIVFCRLAMHNYADPELCVKEMIRVAKPGGKVIVADQEAVADEWRSVEDEMEVLRDVPYVGNLSRTEVEALYEKCGCRVELSESHKVPISAKAWMEMTKTPMMAQATLLNYFVNDQIGEIVTGLSPYQKHSEIYIDQPWLLVIGRK